MESIEKKSGAAAALLMKWSGGVVSLLWVMGWRPANAPQQRKRANTNTTPWINEAERKSGIELKEERRQLSNEINEINWMEQCRNLSLPEAKWSPPQGAQCSAASQQHIQSNNAPSALFDGWVDGGRCVFDLGWLWLGARPQGN